MSIETAEPNRIEAAAAALEVLDVDPITDEAVPVVDAGPADPEAVAVTDVNEVIDTLGEEAPEAPEEDAEAPETAEAAEAPEGEETPEAPADEGKAVPGYKWEEYRRKTARLERDRAQLNSMAKELESKLAEANGKLKAFEDPKEVIEAYKRATGRDEDHLFEAWAKERMDRIENPQRQQAASREQIEAEVRAKIAREQEEHQRSQQAQGSQAIEQQVNEYVRVALDIPYTEEHATTYPYLASLEDSELAGRVDAGVRWAMQNKPEMTFKEVLGGIDKYLENDYTQKQQRVNRWKAPPTPDPKTDEGKTSPPQPGRQLRNADSATSGGTPRLETREDRYAAAGKALGNLL